MSGLVEASADARSKTIGQNFRVRAWVNFNGAGTVAIRGSGNVSSITDNATGDYTVNFTTPLPDNYTIAGINAWLSNGDAPHAAFNVNRVNSSGNEEAPTTSAIRVNTSRSSGSGGSYDAKYVYITIVG
jgi:hypothetical protein